MSRYTACCLLLWGGLLACPTSNLLAQDDEFQAGLLATYQFGTQQLQRVDPELTFHWGTASPFPQLSGTHWQADWTGQILIRSLTPYRLYAQIQGAVTIEIASETVFSANSETLQWQAGETVELPPGFQDIAVRFQPAASGAVLKLFWSSAEFGIEPLPGHLLFHEEDSTQARLVERGRQVFDAHRCANCHRDGEDIASLNPAPALWGIIHGTNADWILAKLQGEHPEAAEDQMPHFGFTREQAEDIVAYLQRLDSPFDLRTAPEAQPAKGGPTGADLFNTLGCVACHQVGELGIRDLFSGPNLTNIGRKRSVDWLASWLASPERMNPQHRMPVFKLSRNERGLLATYLSTLGAEPETIFGKRPLDDFTERSNRGQALVKEFQCANCHKIPAIEASTSVPARLTAAKLESPASCLSAEPDPSKRRPTFRNLERPALASYLKTLPPDPPGELSLFEQGQRVLERKQCLACHARGTTEGLKTEALGIAKATPWLQGQTQLVIPPSLNAVGDKLNDDILNSALSGKQDRVRANWLTVRMPEFKHSREELEALKHYFVEHDRIPTAGSETLPQIDLADEEFLLLGRKLVGAGGWSCIACHQIGDYVPQKTALGTRGSDLMAIGKRLRPEFYLRWTQSPIRVVPGMEMPSFIKPVPGVLNDDPHQQLAAIWAAVNDPRFEPPTNPSQVEQLWQVAEGSAPRVVRDVFTIDAANGGGTVARAFAVGFSNQHGVLFDLDQAAVREWRFGDFARQRTVGKSWYWDLAGAAVATGFDAESDFVLLRTSDQQPVALRARDRDRLAHLQSYRQHAQSIELHYELILATDFDSAEDAAADPGPGVVIPVVEVLSAMNSPETRETGWRRVIQAGPVPAGYQLAIRRPSPLTTHFGAKVLPTPESGTAASEELLLGKLEGQQTQLSVDYLSRSTAPRGTLPELPISQPTAQQVTTLPGYVGERLPLPAAMMPTALAHDAAGRLLITSLKGDLLRAEDTSGDGLEHEVAILQQGLSAPFGVLAQGQDVLVIHKPELLRLSDSNGDGHYDRREVVLDGWGHTDDYHDWVTGPVLGADGSLFVATGSDYSQKNRNRDLAKWRGKVLQGTSTGDVVPYAHELRYPIGLAADAQGRLFVSDQQGVQNTFNEINHIVPGGAYGVPGLQDGEGSPEPLPAAVQVPHPWTRSVNGIFFLPEEIPTPFAGHGIGCEYNEKFLIRFSLQEVDGALQGACYPFTRTTWQHLEETFLGPICGMATASGEIYIGSIFDSGWLGGPNVGEIVRLKPTGEFGNGIREIRAIPGGFEIEFIAAVDPVAAIQQSAYSLSGYTRVWGGSYATNDSGRYSPPIDSIELLDDQRTVRLSVSNLKPGFVYDWNIGKIDAAGRELFPSYGSYTLNRIPGKEKSTVDAGSRD